MSSKDFSSSPPSVKEHQPPPEKKQKIESNNEDEEVDNFEVDSDEDDYNDGLREISDKELKQYCDAVNASDGFDVPFFPGVFCCSMIMPNILDDYSRENLKPLCVAALKDYNEKKNTDYEFLKLEKANSMASRGIAYFLTFVGRDPKDNTTQTFEARVLLGIPKDRGDCPKEVDFCREKTAPSTSDV